MKRLRGRQQGFLLGVPVLLVSTVVSLGSCGAASDHAGSTPSSAPTPSAVPFWQTATARVAALAPAVSTFHALDASSPTPAAPAAATAVPDATVSNMASSLSVSPSSPTALRPSGSQLLDRTFLSTALGRTMHYFIYLPAGYAESGTHYPVLYMLHGYGGSNTEWIAYGFPETADKMMNAGEIPPMIIVFPQGDQAYWVNHADDGQRWGDYTAQDVVQQIDATYRTVPDMKHRAIGGLSMGAHGALQLAMTYPGTFGAVGMDSPTLRDYQSMSAFDGFFGDEAYFNAHDPLHLVQQYPDRARQLKIFLDVGEQDTDWHDSIVAFNNLLTQLNIPHEWHTWPGIHDGTYWGGHSADYLRFYGTALSG